MKKLQDIRTEKVMSSLGCCAFMTETGLVIEGNYRPGEYAPVVYDRLSHRYLAAYKIHPDEPPVLKLEDEGLPGTGQYCKVKLIDPPLIVAPCKWYPVEQRLPNGTHTGEVLGKDYFKTYYEIVDNSKCSGCKEAWTICTTEELAADVGYGPKKCTPFIFDGHRYQYQNIDTPYRPGYPLMVPPILPDPTLHCIYSLWGCQAEILSFGEDQDGKYILWKGYTEWSAMGPEVVDYWGRTGLGYLRMGYMLKSGGGAPICQDDAVIKVDCCEKPSIDRQVKLWWESLSGYEIGGPTCVGQPFIFYGDIKMCEVPEEVFGLYAMICVSWMGYPHKTFYALPEISGSCIPLEWEVSNSNFVIVPSEPYGETAELKPAGDCPEVDDPILCTQEVTVTVRDRCGSTDHATFLPCCTEVEREMRAPLSIGYTSLQIGCSQAQNLSAVGGCAPFIWSKTGNGALNATTGTTIIYTSPSNNPGCGNNDSVTVTDCCGNSSSISIRVSCTVAGNAYQICEQTITACQCYEYYGGVCIMWEWKGSVRQRIWDCAGVLTGDTTTTYSDWVTCNPSYQCPGGSCVMGVCDYWGCSQCNTLMDLRTAEMKAAGCCPDTGLLF